MAASWSLSKEGYDCIEKQRLKLGFGRTDRRWYDTAECSRSTLRRFQKRKPVSAESFTRLCTAVKVPNNQVRSLVDWKKLGISERHERVVSPKAEVFGFALIGFIENDNSKIQTKIDVVVSLMNEHQVNLNENILVMSGTYDSSTHPLVSHSVNYLIRDLIDPDLVWKDSTVGIPVE